MPEKLRSVLVSDRTALITDLRNGMAAKLNLVAVVGEPGAAYALVKEKAPKLLFIDAVRDPESAVSLTARVRRFLPNTLVFALSEDKDSELILRFLRAGVSDYISYPLELDRILTSIDIALDAERCKRREGELFAVFSCKGGQGVTTIAVNVVDHIHTMTEARVLLVDFNLRVGDVALHLDHHTPYGFARFVRDIERLDENLLYSSTQKHPNGFYIMATGSEIRVEEDIAQDQISQGFNLLKEYLDYTIVDLGSDFNEKTAAVLDVADRILLVAQQTVPAIRGLGRILSLFKEAGYPDHKTKIVINRFEKNQLVGRKEIERALKQPLFATVANDYAAVADAITKGDLLAKSHASSAVSSDLRMLAGLLTGIQDNGRSAGPKWSTFLKRFSSIGGLVRRNREKPDLETPSEEQS